MKQEFEKGDRVYHDNLKRYGTFIEMDWSDDDACVVTFDPEDDFDRQIGFEDTRRVSVNHLELVEKARENMDIDIEI